MKKLKFKQLMMITLLLSFNYVSLNAQNAGEVDKTWGASGWIFDDYVANKGEVMRKMIVLSGDKTIHIGNTQQFTRDIILSKHNANGTLDWSFGTNGVAVIDLGGSEEIFSIEELWDGKLLVTGNIQTANPFSIKGIVIRLESDGSIDASFGNAGIKYFDEDANIRVFPRVIKTLFDQNILVGAHVYNFDQQKYDIAVYRLTQGGGVDNSFGQNGSVILNLTDNQRITSMQVNEEGKIIIGGYDETNGHGLIIVLNADGTQNANFNTKGIVSHLKTKKSVIKDVIASNNRLYTIGNEIEDQGWNGFITCYKYDGIIDSSFANNGELILDVGQFTNMKLEQIKQLKNGHLLIAGIVDFETTGKNYLIMVDKSGKSVCDFGKCSGVLLDVSKDNVKNVFNVYISELSDEGILLGGVMSIENEINNRTFLTKLYNIESSGNTSIESISNNQKVIVYPNPTFESFSLKININEKVLSSKLFSIEGREVQIWNGNQSIYNLNNNVQSGQYFLVIQTDKNLYRKQLVVIK
jgi:uncharacterized delta-60 repeat protein